MGCERGRRRRRRECAALFHVMHIAFRVGVRVRCAQCDGGAAIGAGGGVARAVGGRVRACDVFCESVRRAVCCAASRALFVPSPCVAPLCQHCCSITLHGVVALPLALAAGDVCGVAGACASRVGGCVSLAPPRSLSLSSVSSLVTPRPSPVSCGGVGWWALCGGDMFDRLLRHWGCKALPKEASWSLVIQSVGLVRLFSRQ